MKKILTGLFFVINLSLSGATYYVATNGSDANKGTLTSPFATWEKLSSVLKAGDIAYIRGGTYRSNKGNGALVVCRWENINGTVNDTIKIFAYPGEVPVLNLDNIKMTSSYCFIVFINRCSYLWVKGLRITGLSQSSHGPDIFGLRLSGSSHNLIENIEIDHLGMYGMAFESGSDYNYIKNCDIHHIADPYTGYGASNGFMRTGGSTANHLTFYGCRAWFCSDDGWDLYRSDGYVTIDNCWAFWNGYLDESKNVAVGGDGSGFKIGPGTNNTTNVTRIVRNSLAVENTQYGFNQNIELRDAKFASHIYNNVAYNNGNDGFVFTWGPGGDADIFRNNIAYLNNGKPYDGDSGDTQDHNSWNGQVNITDVDFVSVDASQLIKPRKADGSLPDITFMHLVTSSDLIDKGIDVGLPYSGTAPDLGAFEIGTALTAPSIPSILNTVVENSAPSVIELTYDLTLANIVPAISAFSARINSETRSITSVTVSGTKVRLTLSSPVVYGDVVTISYTVPSTNPLQTPAGGQAASFGAQSVSNKINPPVLVVNTPPNVVVNSRPSTYSGFVGTLDATGSYDANKDKLNFTWKVPANIPVSATNGPILEFLAPVVNENKKIEFTVTVSDGKATQIKTVPVTISPYQPELEAAEVVSVIASDFQSPYYPYNIMDGNIGTMWSAIGSDQWIILELSSPFTIQHVKLAFQPGQRRESYFDILGSTDTINWEPILIKSASCSFSGDLQVFDFPASKAEQEFKYIKLVGQGNSANNWNYIAEFRIFGYRHKNPSDYEEQFVKIYPNPAHELVNVLIDEQTFVPDFLKIVSLTGKVIYNNIIEPEVRQLQIPLDFKQGIYIIQMGTGDITMFTQKLVVTK